MFESLAYYQLWRIMKQGFTSTQFRSSTRSCKQNCADTRISISHRSKRFIHQSFVNINRIARITTLVENHTVRRLYNCRAFEENRRCGGRGEAQTDPKAGFLLRDVYRAKRFFLLSYELSAGTN